MTLTNIQRKLKIFSILFSGILLMPTPTNVQACSSSSEVEELRYMLFNPDLLNEKSWWSFFYNSKLNYLDGQVSSYQDEEILTREWIDLLNANTPYDEAFSCLFGSLSDSLLQHNAFYGAIQKTPTAKKYFDLARSSEHVTNQVTWWNDEKTKKEELNAGFSSTTEKIKQILPTETSLFFTKKYAFQLVKLAFYSTDPNLFNITYNTYFKPVAGKSVLDWWALHYKSMQLEREGKTDSANYFHALVFSHTTNKMLISKQFFSNKSIDNVMALANNDAERADILVINEVINPGRSLEGIKTIYALAPNHKHIPLLVSREVNKIEDWLGSTKYANAHITTDTWQEKSLTENWVSDNAYLAEYTGALAGLLTLKDSYPDYYNMSLAYLNLLKGDAGKADYHLRAVNPSTPEIQYQLNAFRVILITQTKDITDNDVQEEIGRLYESLIHERNMKFESQKLLYSLSSYLRYTFANKGMAYLAGLFDNFATNKFCFTCTFNTFEYSMIRYFDLYASVKDMHELLKHYSAPNKNKLEEVLFKPYYNNYYLLDLLSTKYLRQGDVKHAMAALQTIPDNFWYTFSNANIYLDHDPFINDGELYETETMATYTKREIVERMFKLEQEADRDESKKQQNYYLLGNAWYNFTANSWFMLSYGRGSATPDESVYSIAYKKASTYYRQSLQHEKGDMERRARLVYMMALLSNSKEIKQYAMAYEQLKDTDFYAQKNCLTLKDIVSN